MPCQAAKSCACIKKKTRKRKACGCDQYTCAKPHCMNFLAAKKQINPKKKRRIRSPKKKSKFAFLK